MSEILQMKGIVKIYPNGVVANQNVSLSVRAGEIHALIGENGAGKSTLMKILFGIEQPTEGKITYQGKELHFKNPLEAIAHGIGMVHQQFMLVESMSVAENIVLGVEPTRKGFLDQKEIIARAVDIIKKYNFTINPKEKVRDLPIGTRQKVEILKALYRGAQILILDEPTAVLTPQETEELFQELKGLKEQGHTIIFISHKLNEVKKICDRITVMRNGKMVGVYNTKDVSQEEISNLMVGKNMDWTIKRTKPKVGPVLLSVEHVTVVDDIQRQLVKDVSFALHAGTILGVVGVEGNGQSELVDAITGLRKTDKGRILLHGKDVGHLSVHDIRALGMAHIPQDRMEQGTVVSGSVEDNLLATFLDDDTLVHKSILQEKSIRNWSEQLIQNYLIKADSPDVSVKMLSGGNIQKVIIAREFSGNSDCIIANQPTRGIDVGAATFIHQKLLQMRDKGMAILLVSADLSEVMAISDSLIVMYGGRIVAHFGDASQVSEMDLGQYMLGLKKMDDLEIERCVV